MTAHFNGRNETEALLRFCRDSEFFVRKALYLNSNLILLVQWPRIRPLFGGHYSLAIRCFFSPFDGLQSSIEKLNIVGTTSFFSTSWRSLKEGPNKLLTTRFCLKLSTVKCFTQTRECFEGMKHSLFIFISHSLLSFWSVGNLESDNF